MVESWRGVRTLLSMSGTFGRPSGDFRRAFIQTLSKMTFLKNAKISKRLQFFVLRGLAGMLHAYGATLSKLIFHGLLSEAVAKCLCLSEQDILLVLISVTNFQLL